MEIKTDAATATIEAPPVKKRRGRPKKVVAEARVEEAFDMEFASVIKATGVIRVTPMVREEEQKVTVWMGTTDECPYWTIHAGGADFPRYNEIVDTDEGTGQTRRERVRGKVLDLSRTDIELIARAVGQKVVRKMGARSVILNLDSERYRKNPNDKPLGEVVYMHVISETSLPLDWRSNSPESMV